MKPVNLDDKTHKIMRDLAYISMLPMTKIVSIAVAKFAENIPGYDYDPTDFKVDKEKYIKVFLTFKKPVPGFIVTREYNKQNLNQRIGQKDIDVDLFLLSLDGVITIDNNGLYSISVDAI